MNVLEQAMILVTRLFAWLKKKKKSTDLLHASPNTILNKAFKHNLKVIKNDKTHDSSILKTRKR